MQQESPDENPPFTLKCIDHHFFQTPFSSNNPKDLNIKPPVPPPQALTEEQLKEIFLRYDKDRDGRPPRLNKKELKNAFKALGSRLPGLRADLALHHADANRDGFIDHNEFGTLVQYALKHGYHHN